MRATATLMSEHRIIERVIACLEAATDQVREGGAVDAETFTSAIEFFRRFADGCHHKKEEEELFPLLERLGVPREEGPIGVMLDEHVSGREHVRGMSEALAGATAGDPTARRNLVGHALGYAGLLRAHIQKEDRVLFHMADQIIDPADEAALEAAFERIGGEVGAREHARLLRVAEDLGARWGVEAVARRHGGGCGCSCGHHP